MRTLPQVEARHRSITPSRNTSETLMGSHQANGNSGTSEVVENRWLWDARRAVHGVHTCWYSIYQLWGRPWESSEKSGIHNGLSN